MPSRSFRALAGPLVALLLIQPESDAIFHRVPLPQSPVTTLSVALELRTITFPVAGDASYSDTFGACRDGCSRSHKGVDMFADKLTPLVAAVDGTIVRERRNDLTTAGNAITIEDSDGWRYIYVHLNNDTPGTDDDANPQSWIIASGLRAGDRVRAGQLIGYLGDSGNAEETDSHLHFEIRPPGGNAINPTPSVTEAEDGGNVIPASSLQASISEEADWELVVEEWYDQLLDRAPSDVEYDLWVQRLGTGQATEADLVADLALSGPYRAPDGIALRTWLVLFGTLPSDDDLDDLGDIIRDGGDGEELAAEVLASDRFGDEADDNPDVDTADLVPELIDEALGQLGIEGVSAADRDGDPAAVLAEVAASEPVANLTWPMVQVSLAYRGATGELPDDEQLAAWTDHLDQGGLLADVVEGALEDDLPSAPPSGGIDDPDALGYEPGVTVRQGPVLIDLDDGMGGGVGSGGSGSLVGGDADVDYELTLDEGEDADTANLVVHIPLDELNAGDGSVDLDIQLSLTRPDDPDDAPTADASVQVNIDGSGSRRGDSAADDEEQDDEEDRPVTYAPRVTTPTTARTPTTTRTPTTARTATTRTPTTATPTTATPTTRTPTTATPTTPTTAGSTTTTTATTTTTTTASTTTSLEPTTTTSSSTTTTSAPDGATTTTTSTVPGGDGAGGSGGDGSTGGDGSGGVPFQVPLSDLVLLFPAALPPEVRISGSRDDDPDDED